MRTYDWNLIPPSRQIPSNFLTPSGAELRDPRTVQKTRGFWTRTEHIGLSIIALIQRLRSEWRLNVLPLGRAGFMGDILVDMSPSVSGQGGVARAERDMFPPNVTGFTSLPMRAQAHSFRPPPPAPQS